MTKKHFLAARRILSAVRAVLGEKSLRPTRRVMVEPMEERVMLSATLPQVDWSTYLGGSKNESQFVNAVAVDSNGNKLVGGNTTSTDFAGANNSYHNGATEQAFVAKFDAGGALLWSTYLGGSGEDEGLSIAVDSAGNTFMVGTTNSADFAGALNSSHGSGEAFLAKVSPAGATLWSLYLGGSGSEWGRGVAVDSTGNAYVTGLTVSGDFSGASGTYSAGKDVFVAKVDTNGVVQWARYVGGSGEDRTGTITVNGAGEVMIAGVTTTTNLANATNSYHGGASDAYVAKLSALGAVQWITYLGGSGADWSAGNDLTASVALDSNGNALVTGYTASSDLDLANNSFRGGTYDAFLYKVNSTGTPLWSTYLGGAGDDRGICVAIDSDNNAFVGGGTDSLDFSSAVNQPPGGVDGFLTKVSTGGVQSWSIYYGGSDYDWIGSIGLDGIGNAWIGGGTRSSDLPLANNTSHGGDSNQSNTGFEVCLAKIGNADVNPAVFGSSSGNFSDVPFVRAKSGQVNTFRGTGTNAGRTKTFTFSEEQFLGISCLRMEEVESAPNAWTGYSLLAKDANGTPWILKQVDDGVILFEAQSLVQAVRFSDFVDNPYPMMFGTLVAGGYGPGTSVTASDGDRQTIVSTTATLAQYPTYQFIQVQEYSSNGQPGDLIYMHPSIFPFVATNGSGDGWVASSWPNSIPTVYLFNSVATVYEAAANSGGKGKMLLYRTGGNLSQPLTVSYTVGGTGVDGVNYSHLSGTATFLAGRNTATIDVVPLEDGVADAALTVTATLAQDPDTWYNINSTYKAATVSILDSAPTVNLFNYVPTVNEATANSGGMGKMMVYRTGSTAQPLTVEYTVGGTGVDGVNYAHLSGSVTFLAGKSTATIDVVPIEDGIADATLTVSAALAADAGNTYHIANAYKTATVSIVDDSPTVYLMKSVPVVYESKASSGGKGQMLLYRTGSTAGTLTVSYTVGGTGVDSVNYAHLGGTVTFLAGKSTATIDVIPVEDGRADAALTVSATLIADGGPTYHIANSYKTASVSIVDSAPTIYMWVSKPYAYKSGKGNGQFAVYRTGSTAGQLTVNYSVLGGTAVSGTNFTALTGQVTFGVGQSMAYIDLVGINDPNQVGYLTVKVGLVVDGGPSYRFGSTYCTATGYILNA